MDADRCRHPVARGIRRGRGRAAGARHGTDVAVIGRADRPRRRVRPRLTRIQQAAVVRVAARERRQEVIRGVAGRATVIDDNHVRQRHRARVGHHIRPRHQPHPASRRPTARACTHPDRRRTSRSRSPAAAPGNTPDPSRSRSCRWVPRRGTDVAVIGRADRARRRVRPRLTRIQQAVVVRVPTRERRQEVVGLRCRAFRCHRSRSRSTTAPCRVSCPPTSSTSPPHPASTPDHSPACSSS